MPNKRLLVFCNAIDDSTRANRRISTDSPAATKKVFSMCKALINIGIDARVISLGRGSANNDGMKYHSMQTNILGVPTYYLPFNTSPFLSKLITLIFATTSILKYKKYEGKTVVMFYNRNPVFIGTLLLSRLLGFNGILDLEDGETSNRLRSIFMSFFYDRLCDKGAIIACDALKDKTLCRPTHCYYGVSFLVKNNKQWHDKKINFLFSGTILKDTGASLLIESIKIIRKDSPVWAKNVNFFITGKGNEIKFFNDLESKLDEPSLVVLGRLSDTEYNEIIKKSHVGLSLKLEGGKYADTTFPSKVVEFSSNNMLVISTKISDVSKVLGNNGAIYTNLNNPYDLVQKIKWVIENKDQARRISILGSQNMSSYTNSISAAKDLSNFIF